MSEAHGRCGSCRRWYRYDGFKTDRGQCMKIDPVDEADREPHGAKAWMCNDSPHVHDAFMTAPDFGCTEWEAKP